MGVNGLWKLLEPVGRPVTLESLENKTLAVGILLSIFDETFPERSVHRYPIYVILKNPAYYFKKLVRIQNFPGGAYPHSYSVWVCHSMLPPPKYLTCLCHLP